MNILNLLTKEKRVAGIEISDSVVRIAFVHTHKDNVTHKIVEELVLIEEPIAANIIAEGVVIDRALLGKTLKSIWDKAKLNTNYAIVAIPDDKVYSRIFSFPKTVEGARLSEAMRLAIGFQLPMKTDESYLDWERLPNTSLMNEILLATIPRVVAQGYVEALDVAGIKTLALESNLASIARAVKLEPGRTILFTKKTPDGATIFALKDGTLRFSRTLPARFLDESKISAEVRKVKTALGTETKEPIIEMSVMDAHVRDDYAAQIPDPKAKWLIALGAVIRGQIPEGEDNLVSLLPVGTEEAYAYQKATTFIDLVRNMTIGVSVFFVLAFFAAYIFMLSLLQTANRTVATLSASSVSPELLAKEAWVGQVNALTQATGAILAETPVWSKVVDELALRTIDGITVASYAAPSVAERMTISGTAKNRETLNKFKKSLQDSPLFTEVDLPVTNIQKREDIPFSLTFRIKDPSAVYYQ